MLNISFKPKTLELEITGHAKYGNEGGDIVCAAISSLFYTLYETLNQSAEMQEKAPEFKDEYGDGYLRSYPKKEYEGNIACIYRTILIGLELIARNYPENVAFKVVGRKTKIE